MPNPLKPLSVKEMASSPSRLTTRTCISETRWKATGVICYDLHLVRTPELVYSKVIRNEVGPNCVDIGQIAQVTLKFCALQQPDGGFVFCELLKSVCVLDDGISMASGF